MRIQNVVMVIGVLACLIGAFLMFHGSILGDRTTGIATLVGITGIGIISTSKRHRPDVKNEKGAQMGAGG